MIKEKENIKKHYYNGQLYKISNYKNGEEVQKKLI